VFGQGGDGAHLGEVPRRQRPVKHDSAIVALFVAKIILPALNRQDEAQDEGGGKNGRNEKPGRTQQGWQVHGVERARYRAVSSSRVNSPATSAAGGAKTL